MTEHISKNFLLWIHRIFFLNINVEVYKWLEMYNFYDDEEENIYTNANAAGFCVSPMQSWLVTGQE